MTVSAAFSGCLGDSAGSSEGSPSEDQDLIVGPLREIVTDPAGDAVFYNWQYIVDQVRNCRLTYPVPQAQAACDMAMSAATGAVPLGPETGVPAPPQFDVLSLALQETSDALLVTIETAELDESWSGIADGEWPESGSAGGFIGACWSVRGDQDEDWECVYLMGYRDNGALVLESYYDRYDPECNDWWWCTWHVDWDIRYGSPATIELTIPRAIMATSEAGDRLEGLAAFSGRSEQARAELGWSVAAGGFEHTQTLWPGAHAGNADVTETATAPFEFEVPRAPLDIEADGAPVFEDYRGDIGSPFLDELSLEIVETPTTITLASKKALVEEDSQDLSHYVNFGADSTRIVESGYDVRDGSMEFWAGYCTSVPFCERWIDIPVEYEFEYGSPGWVNVTFSREDLGMPRGGSLVHQRWSATGVPRSDAVSSEGLPVPAEARVWTSRWSVSGDWTPPTSPYWLRYDSELAPPESGTSVKADPPGDVAEPTSLRAVTNINEGMFDIRYYEVEGIDPGLTRVTLGITDLNKVEVPENYDAIFFAVGVENGDGAYMAGYHESADGLGQFLCAPDTSVLAEEMDVHDPSDVVWTLIKGAMTPSREPPRSTGASTGEPVGSITIEVPHECFGGKGPGVFESPRTGAGTFLIQGMFAEQAEPTITRMDEVFGDGPATIGRELAAVPSEPSPLVVTVLGAEIPVSGANFWDILGIATFVVATVVGLLLVQRRRGHLSRFLTEIEEARKAHRGKPQALRASLALIRGSAKHALIKGRLNEGQFVVVEQHIKEARRGTAG